jgi:hypothetical protein
MFPLNTVYEAKTSMKAVKAKTKDFLNGNIFLIFIVLSMGLLYLIFNP